MPALGHGFAADGTPNAHCFQTLIGEGRVLDPDGEPVAAAAALSARGVDSYSPGSKEGLALINGITALPAYAIYAHRQVSALQEFATVVAAVSLEALAASKDAIHPALARSNGGGVGKVIERLNQLLEGSGFYRTSCRLRSLCASFLRCTVHIWMRSIRQVRHRADDRDLSEIHAGGRRW